MDWEPIHTAPRDGTLLDVRFDPSTAERDYSGRQPLSMAEFYAPGCTRPVDPTDPVIERVEFSGSHFRPVTDDGTRLYACDMALTLTHCRLHIGASGVGEGGGHAREASGVDRSRF